VDNLAFSLDSRLICEVFENNMNVLTALCLYLFGVFSLIALCVANVLPVNYLGGFLIWSFYGTLLFIFGSAVWQGEQMVKQARAMALSEALEAEAEKEPKEEREEQPIMVAAR
jgi:hypothetical protein